MSIGVARIVKVATAGLAAAALLLIQQAAADNNGITRFAIRNCTDAQVLFCTYNKDDSILALPYDANVIKPGKKKRASCGSANRCKVFSLISANDIKTMLTGPKGAGMTIAFSALVVGAGTGSAVFVNYSAASAAAELGAASLGVVGGLIAGGGAAIGVIKAINAVKAGDTCQQAQKDSRKAIGELPDAKTREAARDALKRTLSGSWPDYKNYSFVTQDNGVPALVEGDKC